MFEERARHYRWLTMVWDSLLTAACLLAACGIASALKRFDPPDLTVHIRLLLFIVPAWIPCLIFSGAYEGRRTSAHSEYMWPVVRAVSLGVTLLLTALFLFKVQSVSRTVLISFAILNMVALAGIRIWVLWRLRRAFERGRDTWRVVIIGSGSRAMRLAETLAQQSQWGVHIIGYLDPDPFRAGQRCLGAPILGTPEDITHVLKEHVVDEVILAIPRTMLAEVERIAQACEEEGVKFMLMADIFKVNVSRMRLLRLGAIPLLTFEPVAFEEWRLLVKRILDLCLVVPATLALLPLMGAIALAVKLDSRGPALFVQSRVGMNKRRFRFYKFRTMVQDSERILKQIEHLNEAQGPIFKMANDPRITRIGRFLRHTSLDELPQLFNVIKGDMSLVGPRPMSLRDVSLFDQGIMRKRFSVKPGLVCLREISGRSKLSFAKWLELDLTYIQTWSFWLDLKIILKTIPVVLRGTGAV